MRNAFIFSIGYQDDTLIADRTLYSQYRHLSFDELLEKGFYRAAFCLAVFDHDQEKINRISTVYTHLTGKVHQNLHQLFGVVAPQKIRKIMWV